MQEVLRRGIDSGRGIAWRSDDSLALRVFLGIELTNGTPDGSSLSKILDPIDLETRREVFACVLRRGDRTTTGAIRAIRRPRS